MKKKITIGIICFMVVLLLSSCGSSVSTEKKVKKYLKEKYPGEEFKVEYYRDVTIYSATGGCAEKNGKTWNVTSLDTGMTFYVQDDLFFNSFTCDVVLDDDYFEVYFTDAIKKINDSRIKIDEIHINDIDDQAGYGFLDSIFKIGLDINDFSSKEELVRFIVSLHDKLLSDSRIEKYMPHYFWLYIYNQDDISISFDFRECDNENFVESKLKDIL